MLLIHFDTCYNSKVIVLYFLCSFMELEADKIVVLNRLKALIKKLIRTMMMIEAI